MRTLAKIAVVLLFTISGFAQHTALNATTWRRATLHDRDQFAYTPASDNLPHRHWYWEDTSSTGSPTPFPMDRSSVFFNANDFSPVSLAWDFSGKHPLIPIFEVAGFDVKPGSRPLNPDAPFGSISPPRLWNRAGHALIAVLRY